MTAPFAIAKILVPLDGSELAEHAVPHAIALANDTTEIVFLEVLLTSEPVRDILGRVTVTQEEMAEIDYDQATDALRAAAQRWSSLREKAPTLVVTEGDPAAQILERATALDCDLIVAASHGRGAIKRLAFGSVADRLARASTVPVMLVRPNGTAPDVAIPALRRVVVPYDGSELANEALPVAAALAQRLQAPVHLIRVISPTAQAPAPMPMEPFYPSTAYEQIYEEIEDEGKASLETGTSLLGDTGTEVSTELLVGAPAATIQDRTQAGDVIVMTSHGRSGFKRWLIGSVAEQLVREGSAPVVLVPASSRAKSA